MPSGTLSADLGLAFFLLKQSRHQPSHPQILKRHRSTVDRQPFRGSDDDSAHDVPTIPDDAVMQRMSLR